MLIIDLGAGGGRGRSAGDVPRADLARRQKRETRAPAVAETGLGGEAEMLKGHCQGILLCDVAHSLSPHKIFREKSTSLDNVFGLEFLIWEVGEGRGRVDECGVCLEVSMG